MKTEKIIIYEKHTGRVVYVVPTSQDISLFLSDHNDDCKKSLAWKQMDISHIHSPNVYANYKVVNGDLIEMSNREKLEIAQFRRILTEDERLINRLNPTQDEIKKAEQTIELLTLIQEVI